MEEHVTTIEKSMKQIVELGTASEKNYNQIVRWVENKEHHADEIAGIVTEYFLQQRLKPMNPSETPEFAAYMKQLNLCHRLLVHSMKVKQSTDLEEIEKLRTVLHDFAHEYLGEAHKH
jgi:nickel superoxide dismutase